jgi:hypothetical protein
MTIQHSQRAIDAFPPGTINLVNYTEFDRQDERSAFDVGWNAALIEAEREIGRMKYWRKDKPGTILFDYCRAAAIEIVTLLRPAP